MSEVKLEFQLPITEFLARMDSGEPLSPGTVPYHVMEELGARARWITTYLNSVPHKANIVHGILEELTLVTIDPSVVVEPPFLTGIGINLRFGSNVHVGQNCHFEDQGGIRIGDGCMIDAGVYIGTLVRDARVENRSSVIPSPVFLHDDVWIGAHSTVLPGVTIGAQAVVLPGSVVMYDVLPGTVFGGVPAQYLRDI